MDATERARYASFSRAVDAADPNMEHDADNPITAEEVASSLSPAARTTEKVDQIVRFINTRPSDPFANL